MFLDYKHPPPPPPPPPAGSQGPVRLRLSNKQNTHTHSQIHTHHPLYVLGCWWLYFYIKTCKDNIYSEYLFIHKKKEKKSFVGISKTPREGYMNTAICCKSTNQSIGNQASHENQPDLQSLERYNFCILLVAGKDQALTGTAVQTHWQIKQELSMHSVEFACNVYGR